MKLPSLAQPVPERLLKSHRLFQFAALLRERERSVHDLVLCLYPLLVPDTRAWKAAERAIQRDLNDLALLEPDFEVTQSRSPRYRISTPQSQMHPTEALMLHAAARALYHRSSGEAGHHRAALKQLSFCLPGYPPACLRVPETGRQRGVAAQHRGAVPHRTGSPESGAVPRGS